MHRSSVYQVPSVRAAVAPRGPQIVGYIALALCAEALLLRGAPRVIVPVAESAGIHTKSADARTRPGKLIRTVVVAVTSRGIRHDA